MFLSRKRKGASFLIMVVIMALVMSMFAVSVSQLTRTRSATLISDATEKQVLYLAEDAVNQRILALNGGAVTNDSWTPAPELGVNYSYRTSSSLSGTPRSGTVTGTGRFYSAGNEISKTVYVDVKEGAEPLMVYIPRIGGAENVPYYAIWNGTAWGNERQAWPVQGGRYSGQNAPHIQFISLAFDPGSNHAMLGMQDSFGNIWVEEWDGTTSSWSQPFLLYDRNGMSDLSNPTRVFDIAYENAPLTTGGANRAILVYAGETGYEERHVPYFRVWTGSAWLDAQEVPHIPDGMSQPSFIELATNPMTTGSRSKEIGMIYQDSGRRVFGEVWTGTTWSTMMDHPDHAEKWADVASSSRRAVGLAYQNDGTLVFGYGEGDVGNSRIWNGAMLGTPVQFTEDHRTIQWLTMNSVPGTNVVVAVYVTSANVQDGLYSSTLTGTSWDNTTVPAWASSTPYHVGDLVTSGGIIYKCTNAHDSRDSRRPPSENYWQTVAAWGVPGWSATISYHDGDFATSGGIVYEYIHDHPSAGDGPPDADYWRTTRVWDQQTTYSESSLVTYQGMTYESIHNHSPNKNKVPSTEHSYWQELPGWGTVTYHSGDLVTFGGIVYQCTSAHISSDSRKPPNVGYWQVWSSGRAVADLGTVYSDNSPYFAFASGGADKWTVVFSSHDSALLYRTWTGGPNWDAVQHLVGNNWTPSYVAVVAPDSQTTLSAYYPDARYGGGGNGDDEDEVQSIVGWHTTNSAGTWVESSFDGDPASNPYERIVIAIPTTSGSGFTVVKGTWRENY